MITYIEGTVLDIEAKEICVLTPAGVGYGVQMAKVDMQNISIGDTVKLSIYTHVREDALELYGFTNRSDKTMFEQLTSISGIGPKSALGILSLSDSQTLYEHVIQGNTAYLTQISGIGKKMAEKIVVELRDKLPKIAFDFAGNTKSVEKTSSTDIEVFEALKAMGYSPKEAKHALDSIPTGLETTADKIKAALRVVQQG